MNNKDWNHIYTQLSPKLLGICRRYIPDIYAAEDILQDSFITAMQKEHQLKDEKLLFAWLKKIVVNNTLQYLRKSSRETHFDTETSEIPEIPSTMSENMEEKTSVLAYDFTREELLSSIDSLPSHHKSVFNLFYLENHSHAEIAGMLGISVNTSKSHLLRAKKSIQTYLVSHVLKPDTQKKKKKIIPLLIFFGFGNRLWAQSFRSRFSDFSVTPTKSFEIPETVQSKKINFQSGSTINLKTKIIAAACLLIIIAVYVMIFRPYNQNQVRNNSTSMQTLESKTERTEEGTKTEISNRTVKDSNTGSMPNKESTKGHHNESAEIREKSSKITSNKTKITVKDSVETAPKKVIVVKKIIQRDTIYVER
ncbi:RNA polymerase sigma factor [Chryseobacterium angstadtii]|uniref:RNA polymerase sigma factor n=1 Tax=Chryseobacterium angstadtii TaxID=558151 RepID=UPI00065AF7E6|nr:sigma-70 family RNA polymerase sigma factor [Chryseobacterium angstadtii]